jgi:arginine decarboxylase
MPELTDDDPALLHEMVADYRDASRKNVSVRRVREIYHDLTFDKERAHELFNSGVLTSSAGRAMAEQVYFAPINAIARAVERHRDEFRGRHHGSRRRARRPLLLQLLRSFSQLPDSWANRPALPDHADSPVDGGADCAAARCRTSPATRTARSIASWGEKNGRPSLELHDFRDGEPYMLGVFLTGAYQEILGDLHNLFGDTNAVHIRLGSSGNYEVTDLVHGDTVTEVLNYVQFRATDLLQTFRRKVGAAKHLSRQEANTFIADYVAGLEGYTYLEGDAAQ